LVLELRRARARFSLLVRRQRARRISGTSAQISEREGALEAELGRGRKREGPLETRERDVVSARRERDASRLEPHLRGSNELSCLLEMSRDASGPSRWRRARARPFEKNRWGATVELADLIRWSLGDDPLELARRGGGQPFGAVGDEARDEKVAHRAARESLVVGDEIALIALRRQLLDELGVRRVAENEGGEEEAPRGLVEHRRERR